MKQAEALAALENRWQELVADGLDLDDSCIHSPMNSSD
jgi:hypothetical protein